MPSGTGDYGAVDTYFHYDQVGSVVATSNAAGTGTSVLYADAFGNPLANWESGLWAEPSGWRHNTKAFDADIDTVYMYQRWYLSEMGMFMSRAPMRAEREAQYSFAGARPLTRFDPHGEYPEGGSGRSPCQPAVASVELLGIAVTIATYGEWCGGGRPGSGENPTPVDDLDKCCRAHDKCYDKAGVNYKDKSTRGDAKDSCDSGFCACMTKGPADSPRARLYIRVAKNAFCGGSIFQRSNCLEWFIKE